MVAISLYKGNLHKVPDVPRTWLMPQRKISLKDFKTLVRRRNIALSRTVSSAVAGTTTITTTTVVLTVADNPNPNFNSDTGIREPEAEVLLLKEEEEEEEEEVEDGNIKKPVAKAEVDQEARAERGSELEGGGAGPGKLKSELADLVTVEIKPQVEDHNNTVVENEVKIVLEDCQVKMDGKKDGEILLKPNIEVQGSNKMIAESSIDNRKKDVEEKLRILKEKKHGLVQVLKQILNAEEELKRRSTQGVTGRSSVPLHVDIPNDTGSVTRLATPRMGSDGILTGEVEGGEPDGMSNHQNADGLHSLRLSSQSPSSDFQHKKPANNVIPNSARTSLGLIGSPSFFAVTPTVQQGHPSNLPTLTVSGTSYIASSPSPAASGGTSVFRDSQIPSPWN